jgi:hypothetical protein
MVGHHQHRRRDAGWRRRGRGGHLHGLVARRPGKTAAGRPQCGGGTRGEGAETGSEGRGWLDRNVGLGWTGLCGPLTPLLSLLQMEPEGTSLVDECGRYGSISMACCIQRLGTYSTSADLSELCERGKGSMTWKFIVRLPLRYPVLLLCVLAICPGKVLMSGAWCPLPSTSNISSGSGLRRWRSLQRTSRDAPAGPDRQDRRKVGALELAVG